MKILFRIVMPATIVIGLIVLANIETPARQLLPLRLVAPKEHTSALFIIGQNKDIFQKHGLAVDLKFCAKDAGCLNSLKAGQADIAQAHLTPLALKIASGADLAALTQLHIGHDNTMILFRKDRQIQTEEDLIGKKIGYTPGTNAEFFLSLFLSLNFLDSIDVKHIHLSERELRESLRQGTIDAAVFWAPSGDYQSAYSSVFGSFSSNIYSDFSAAAASRIFLRQNPETVRRFLSALTEASHYYESHTEKARRLVSQQILGKNGTSEWAKLRIQLGLTNIFETMLREEVLWARQAAKAAPLTEQSYIDAGFLREILPQKVLIK